MPGLVELAGNLVQGALQLGRNRALGKLSEQRFYDWLGLLGITRLEDRPGCPELVLGLEAAHPQGVLKILPSQALFLVEYQRNPISSLRLGQRGKLGRSDFQVAQGAGAKFRLWGLDRFGVLAWMSRGTEQAGSLEIDRSLKEMTEPLKPRFRRGHEGLDVLGSLLETIRILPIGEGHFDCHGMQAHDRDGASRLGGGRLLECLFDHLYTAVAPAGGT